MSIFLRGACALMVAAVCGTTSFAQESGSDQPEAVKALFEGADFSGGEIEQTGFHGGCNDCDLGCGPGGGCPIAGGQIFFGAEYLAVRANFSEATAFLSTDVAVGERREQFQFDYGDSYRLYGGYRLCECGGEINFSYTSFDSEGSFDPVTSTVNQVITAPFELGLVTGDTLTGSADVEVDTFDIAFSKTIPLGCLDRCDPCGDCGDSCGGCADGCGCGPVCPAWDITWTGGVRFSDVGSELNWTATPTAGTPLRTASSRIDFNGAGLRFGLAGRRYLGRKGLLSAYVRGDISLLLGEVDYLATAQPTVPTVGLTSTQVVPVTEIEAGLTGYLTSNVTVTGGYLLSSWHDLGHRPEYDFNAASGVDSFDDANLLTFDGFFVRAEAAF